MCYCDSVFILGTEDRLNMEEDIETTFMKLYALFTQDPRVTEALKDPEDHKRVVSVCHTLAMTLGESEIFGMDEKLLCAFLSSYMREVTVQPDVATLLTSAYHLLARVMMLLFQQPSTWKRCAVRSMPNLSRPNMRWTEVCWHVEKMAVPATPASKVVSTSFAVKRCCGCSWLKLLPFFHSLQQGKAVPWGITASGLVMGF